MIAGGADVPSFGMSAPCRPLRGAHITTKGVVTYAPPAISRSPDLPITR